MYDDFDDRDDYLDDDLEDDYLDELDDELEDLDDHDSSLHDILHVLSVLQLDSDNNLFILVKTS